MRRFDGSMTYSTPSRQIRRVRSPSPQRLNRKPCSKRRARGACLDVRADPNHGNPGSTPSLTPRNIETAFQPNTSGISRFAD